LFAYDAYMPDSRHRVYLSFQLRGGWRCQFLEKDLRTSLPLVLNFATPDKVIVLVEHGGGLFDLASRQALDIAIETGRGGVFLNLSDEQHAKLRTGPRPAPRR